MKLNLYEDKNIKEEKVDIHFANMRPVIKQLIDTVKSERPTLSGRPADEEIDDGEEIILDAKEIYYLDHVDRKLFAYTKDGLNSFVHSRYHTSLWLDFITIEYFQRQRSKMH